MSGFEKFIVFLDKCDGFNFGESAEIIHYSVSHNYAKRMSVLLEKIDYEYILMMHDVDLPLNIERSKIPSIVSLIDRNGIDRLSFGVFKSQTESDVLCGEGICVTQLSPGMSANFYTPFDHSPSIWRRESLLDLYTHFNGESYFSIEHNDAAQSYADNELKCYGIQKTSDTKLVYHRGFVYSTDFNFLHITIQGKFMSRVTYFDLIPEFEQIVSKYGISLPTTDTTFVKKNELD